MKKVLLLTALLIVSFQFSFAQTPGIVMDWKQFAGYQDSVWKVKIIKDSYNNVVTAGFTVNSGTGADLMVMKYNSVGDTIWFYTFSSSGNARDQAMAIAVDEDDNVYVAGFTATASQGYDWVIQKIDTSGNMVWSQTINGTANQDDYPGAMCIYNDTIYITGITANTFNTYDATTVAYDTSGAQQWYQTYDNVHLFDIAFDISADTSKVVISGASQNTFVQWDYLSLSFAHDGTPLDTITIQGTTNSFDRVNAVTNDGNGNFYLTGAAAVSGQDFNMRTVKINIGDTIEWIKDFDLEGMNDEGNGILTDTSGYIYICGQSKGMPIATGLDWMLIKYDSNGDTVWTSRYNGGGDDIAKALCFDSFGNIIVTGTSKISGTADEDIYTIAYDTDGNILWQVRFDGIARLKDLATGICADNKGNIYVIGQSQDTSGNYFQVTIKYRTDYFILPLETIPQPSSMLFYPNWGQIIDTNDSLRQDVYYYTINQNPQMFFLQDTISFVFAKTDGDTATADTLERISMTIVTNGNLTDAPLQSNTHKEDQLLNYYLTQCPDGILDVAGSENLFYRDAYPKIDMIIANNNAGMKFYFVLNPGADIGDFLINFTGQQSLSIVSSSDLQIDGQLGSIIYERPRTYYIDSLGNKTALPWLTSYNISGNVLRFILGGSYDDTQTLVLECARTVSLQPNAYPQPTWCTYVGGNQHDEFAAITTDAANHLYLAGTTRSSYFPATNGIHPYYNFQGNDDFLVARTTPNRKFQFLTYYGGSQDDDALGIAYASDSASINVVGYSWSINLFPRVSTIAENCFQQTTFDAGHRIMGAIAQFDTIGHVKWATLFPISKFNAVDVDNDANIFIGGYMSEGWQGNGANSCGAVSSATSFPYCSPSGSSYLQTYIDNDTTGTSYGIDAIILKFNNSGEMLWSTLWGGDSYDKINALKVDKNNSRLYITGLTSSRNRFPLDSAGGYFTRYLDNTDSATYTYTDAFLAKFDLSGQLLSSTFYGGRYDDEATSIAVSSNQDVYLVGYTHSLSTGYPFCAPPTLNNNSGFPYCYNGWYHAPTVYFNTGDGWISKFNSSGTLTWSSFIGGQHEDKARGITVTPNDNIFVIGTTNSPDTGSSIPNKFPVYPSPDFYYNNLNHFAHNTFNEEGFIMGFNPSNGLRFSTFFGSSGRDFPLALTTAGNLKLFVCGWSDATGLPVARPDTIAFYQDTTFTHNLEGDCFIAEFSTSALIGIDEITHVNNQLAIFPNPANNTLNIQLSSNLAAKLNFEIFDALGRIVKTYNVKYVGFETISLDVHDIADGFYILNMKDEKHADNNISAKFVVSK